MGKDGAATCKGSGEQIRRCDNGGRPPMTNHKCDFTLLRYASLDSPLLLRYRKGLQRVFAILFSC